MPALNAAIGHQLPQLQVEVERGRVQLFARVIGETDPVYLDVEAARAAGHPDLAMPPTFLFALELEQPDPFGYLAELGVDLRQVLHGEQAFVYHQPAHAGETLTVQPRITDVHSKRGGAMTFIVKETSVSRADGATVAALTSTIIVQNSPATP